MRSPIQTRYEDLPQELPIFPLSGALLLPWGRLPLNIFEPRYLNMTLDALKAGRVFGMIQPDYDKASKDTKDEPAVYGVGCVGRISSFEETEDGRLLIVLKGLLRFRVREELEGRAGYRRTRVSYDDFKSDLDPQAAFDFDRKKFLECLGPYLEAHAMPVGIDVLKGLSDSTLVTSVAMICPFDPREKQALLEAPTLGDRAAMLQALLQMGMFEAGAPDVPRQ
ncbi:MAG: LON peptidase substrate-binding domain-containing protein [Rhodospirillaceae bacterium]|nr:LON peptidase substrate-binding domain-containing protein [Rhodospirillaceae bacterium]